jgi:hypothetical protein
MKTRLSINETALAVGVSRASLYKKYFDTGILSRQRDSNDKVYIDASEIARVFPDADLSRKKKAKSSVSDGDNRDVENSIMKQNNTDLIAEKERAIQRLQKDLDWHKDQIAHLQTLLEHKPVVSEPEKKVKTGLLARLAKAVLDD